MLAVLTRVVLEVLGNVKFLIRFANIWSNDMGRNWIWGGKLQNSCLSLEQHNCGFCFIFFQVWVFISKSWSVLIIKRLCSCQGYLLHSQNWTALNVEDSKLSSDCFIMSIKTNFWRIYFYLSGREKEVFHPLVHCPVALMVSLSRLKHGAGNGIWVSHVGCRNRVPGPSCTSSPGVLAQPLDSDKHSGMGYWC